MEQPGIESASRWDAGVAVGSLSCCTVASALTLLKMLMSCRRTFTDTLRILDQIVGPANHSNVEYGIAHDFYKE